MTAVQQQRRNGIIIFSRFDSRRLPGKALIEISGRPLLGRVIDRARLVSAVDLVIVSTTTRSVDDPIAEFARKEGVHVFRGAVDDVAGRALETCREFGLQRFARICGDRPFFDPELVDMMITRHADDQLDVMTTMMPRTYPPGLTTEIIAPDALERAISSFSDDNDREHLTQYFYRHPEDFRIRNQTQVGPEVSDLHLVVDNPHDLARARYIAEQLEGDGQLSAIAEIARFARQFDTEINLDKGIQT